MLSIIKFTIHLKIQSRFVGLAVIILLVLGFVLDFEDTLKFLDCYGATEATSIIYKDFSSTNDAKYKTYLLSNTQIHLKPTITVKLLNHLPMTSLMYPIEEILSERYNIKISDINYDIVFDTVYGEKSIKEERGIKIFYTSEAVLPNLSEYDLVLGFDYIDDYRYIRFPYYYFVRWRTKIKANYNMRSENGCCNPHKKNFACFLVSNSMEKKGFLGSNKVFLTDFDGVVARNRIFHKLSLYKKVVSGGKHLNNIGFVVPEDKTMEWLSDCKFVIAYENHTYKGYITEKPFQAYFAGAIPIYYGDITALKDINKQALIYAGDFKTEDDLVNYIKKIDNNDKLYCDIWNQNLIVDPNINWESKFLELRAKIFEILDRNGL